MRAGWILLLALVLVVLGVSAWWVWPKSQPLTVHPSYVGLYRGLGLTDDDGFFGKSYYHVTISDEYGRTEVCYSKPGYNRFRGFYKDGTLRAEGECLVELTGHPKLPCPDVHSVRFGEYYTPDGTLASEIEDGAGVQTYWTPDGVKTWELELRDFKRVRHAMWYPSGQLLTKKTYKDGQVDGPFVSFYPSGAKKTEGAYSTGKRSGKWIRYREDGSVEEVEEYGGSR